jgi:hypothetical protein
VKLINNILGFFFILANNLEYPVKKFPISDEAEDKLQFKKKTPFDRILTYANRDN